MADARSAHGTYIHGTSREEQERLAWMNALLNRRELDALGLAGGERVLEMGAGTGLFARALLERLPRGTVLGIELDERQLAAARAASVGEARLELRQGDALAPPLTADEWGRFDVAHARFLLEHLTRPAEAVHAMARAVRPGGRVVLVDDDHEMLRVWPEAPLFQRLWGAYCEQYCLRGMDPWIGRRLVELASLAGLRPVRAELIFFGACAGMETFATVVDNLHSVVAGAAEDIARSGSLSDVRVADGLRELREWAAKPAAALWYAVPFVEAVRPD